ncbi:MAG: tRNA 2-thiocytidine(32) synthetase TtcA [Proteobacteria bacterium]|nr:tRNA 2-thiocytidine(32) synthetase TtcA [Pseudomonadota bacterium]
MSASSTIPARSAAQAPDVGPTEELPRLERRLGRAVGQAVADFGMIAAGDRVLVALSGGKDSATLLELLLRLQRRAPVPFTLEAVNLDPGYADYQPEVVRRFAESHGVRIHLLRAPVEQLVAEKLAPGQAACPLCSRIRRGAFYTLARREGFTKLALGHHLDDLLETLLINLFYAGTLRAMAPALEPKDGPPTVIRPLCYALERDIAAYARARQLPIIPCASPHCAATDRRRQVIKRLLTSLEAEHPDLKLRMRKALTNVQPATLLDPALLRLARDAGLPTAAQHGEDEP